MAILRHSYTGDTRMTFDWFVLAMDLLYVLGLVDLQRGRIMRSAGGQA